MPVATRDAHPAPRPGVATCQPSGRRRGDRAGVSRRRLLTGIAAAGLLTGCSATPPAAPAAAPRTRAHPGGWGTVELPLAPARTVAMYATDSDFAHVLGLPLVGAYGTTATAFPPYQAGRLDGVQSLVSWPDPDYEAIAALRPDLVVHTAGTYTRSTGSR